MKEGQKGGEFLTPTSIVRPIVEVIEPFHGKILDPACGSGGICVQSAKFVRRDRKNPGSEIGIYGQERVRNTIRVRQMTLAVSGIDGAILVGNTYYEDRHITGWFVRWLSTARHAQADRSLFWSR